MIQRTEIVLGHEDIFKAIKAYISDHVDGTKGEDVCNYKVSFQNEKPLITVQLRDKEVSDGL